jgi:predicted phosphodiesterase
VVEPQTGDHRVSSHFRVSFRVGCSSDRPGRRNSSLPAASIVSGLDADPAPYALISDVHGNARALEAVLTELERFGIDDGIVLGDVAQGGDEPAAVLDRLAGLGWPVILGNADHLLLEVPADTNEEITAELLARREWTLSQLAERHLDQIRSFHVTYARDGVLAFHGSPRHFEDVLLPDTEDLSPWQVEGHALLAGGHTHFQWAKRLGGAVYVNPGSVGRPVYRWNDRRPVAHAESQSCTASRSSFAAARSEKIARSSEPRREEAVGDDRDAGRAALPSGRLVGTSWKRRRLMANLDRQCEVRATPR